jgi:hypothetical protein
MADMESRELLAAGFLDHGSATLRENASAN